MDDIGYGDSTACDDEVYNDMQMSGNDEYQQYLVDDMCEDLMKDDVDFDMTKPTDSRANITTLQIQSCPKGKVWSENTDSNIACWWCCHTFKTTPVSLPTNYNSHRNSWTFYGIFCGPSCAKAFSAVSMQGGDMGLKAAWLTKCLKQVYGLQPPFRCAPPRQCLKMFGGTMTIAQFRKASKFCTWSITMPPFDPQVIAAYGSAKTVCKKTTRAKTSSKKPQDMHDSSTSTCSVSTIRASDIPQSSYTSSNSHINTNLKLKRKKIDTTKNNILDSMKITRTIVHPEQ